jgi:hypothetical protein
MNPRFVPRRIPMNPRFVPRRIPMIAIRFGRWIYSSGRWFTWVRVLLLGYIWTPFCWVSRRRPVDPGAPIPPFPLPPDPPLTLPDPPQWTGRRKCCK